MEDIDPLYKSPEFPFMNQTEFELPTDDFLELMQKRRSPRVDRVKKESPPDMGETTVSEKEDASKRRGRPRKSDIKALQKK
jgi:hypothetical protein